MVLLENVRFNKGEKKNNDELASRMAALCDIYVMDAFATAHRAEASTHGVGKFAPVACAGPLLTNELDALEQALSGKTVLQGSSPLAGKVGEQLFDARFSIVDDPLTAGRPSSRPIDDECVPSRSTNLIATGAVGSFVYDLETAARARTRASSGTSVSRLWRATIA